MSVTVYIEDLHVTFGSRTVLDGVTMTLKGGELNALIGPNGAGKTTLVHALLGFLPFEGRIRYQGLNCSPRIGYVPQNTSIEPGAPLTTTDFLASGLSHRPVWSGVGIAARETIETVLADVGIPSLTQNRLDSLSGGEFQRVLLAQALLRRPDLLILDEPNTGMDIIGHQLFCGLVEKIHREHGTTTLLITHDLGVVADHAHRVVGINQRVLFEGPVPDVLSEENLVQLFGPHTYGWQSLADHHRHKVNGEQT
ncbi:MAG: metal ABC transporter ATP-binding protein [bacterium]